VSDAAGGAVAATLGAATAVAATDGEAIGDMAMVAVGLGLGVPDGRTRGDAEAASVVLAAVAAEAAGVGLAALALGAAVVAGVGVGLTLATDGDGLAGVAAGVVDPAGVALGLGLGVPDGRTRGDAEAAGVALAAVVAGVGVGLTLATDGDCVAAVAAGAVDSAGVADAVVSTGFTNFFGGPFGGGVASARIFVRARSTAERSVTAFQPLSMFRSTTRSLTRRGRTKSRTTVSRGTDTSSSSPRTLACVSVLRSRRNR
jgi:hypothetical protein